MGSKKTEDLQWLPRGWASQHMGKGGGAEIKARTMAFIL